MMRGLKYSWAWIGRIWNITEAICFIFFMSFFNLEICCIWEVIGVIHVRNIKKFVYKATNFISTIPRKMFFSKNWLLNMGFEERQKTYMGSMGHWTWIKSHGLNANVSAPQFLESEQPSPTLTFPALFGKEWVQILYSSYLSFSSQPPFGQTPAAESFSQKLQSVGDASFQIYND